METPPQTRDLTRTTLAVLCIGVLIAANFWILKPFLTSFVWAIITAVPFVGPLVGLIGILFIFRDDRRCLHDHLAGTRVVQA